MKKTCSIFLTVFLLAGTQAFGQNLTVAFFDLVPHVQTAPAQEASGPGVAYLKDIAAKMGVTVTFDKEALPLSRLIYKLQNKEVDVALAMGKNPQREASMVFPDKPFHLMKPSLMVLKTSSLTVVSSADDLLPLKIGTFADGFLSPMMKTPGLKLDPLSVSDVIVQNYKKMAAGRISAVYSPDEAELVFEARQNHFLDQVKIINLPEKPVGLFTTFAKGTDPALVTKYETALAQMPAYTTYLEKAGH